jgi:putative CocE/NonD family hydrolase
MRSTRFLLPALAVLGLVSCRLDRGPNDGWPSIHGPVRAERASFDGWTRDSRYLTMRDGARIAVDVYLPRGLTVSDKVPAILHQTSYHRSYAYRWPLGFLMDGPGPLVELFVSRGYAWIDVDVRGSGASFGSRPMPWSPEEVRDGAEIVDWIVRQPWSNGKVGATGISYAGTAAEMLLINRHRAVKAIAPRFSLYDVYPDIAFPGGIQLVWFTEAWARLNRTLDANRLPSDVPWYGRVAISGVRRVDEDRDGRLLDAALREHAVNYDPHLWALDVTYRDDVPRGAPGTADRFSPHSFAREIRASGAAVYSYSGWLDGAYQVAAIKRHLALRGGAPHRLILGPWDHGGRRQISPDASSPVVGFDQGAELLRFFDHHLRARANGIEAEPPVHYFTMGEERWKSAERWPPPSRTWSLYPDGGGRLSAAPGSATGADEYPADFTVGTGVATRWRALLGGIGAAPYPDRARRDARLLVYTSAPLVEAVEVTGHPVVRLLVSATTTDAALFVYLEDVDESGRVSYVTEGQLRALHRKRVATPPRATVPPVPQRTFARADGRPLVPGEPTALVFDLLPTSYRFARGHAVRIAVAAADIDHFARIPAEGPSTFRLHLGGNQGSRIDLPRAPG